MGDDGFLDYQATQFELDILDSLVDNMLCKLILLVCVSARP